MLAWNLHLYNFSINHELGLPFLKPPFDRCFQRLPHTTPVTSFFLQCKNNHLFFHFWAHFLLFLALLIIIMMMTIHVNNSVHFHHYTSFVSLCFSYGLLLVLIAQSCLTLCNPMDCSLPGSSVHGILQAKTLEWVAIPFLGDLPKSGIEARSPALLVDLLLSEPPGKPRTTGYPFA